MEDEEPEIDFLTSCYYSVLDLWDRFRAWVISVACSSRFILPPRQTTRFGRMWIALVTMIVLYK